MKCPEMAYEGFNRKIRDARWSMEGKLESVSFYDGHGNYQTAFQIRPNVHLNQGVIYLDLEKQVVFN